MTQTNDENLKEQVRTILARENYVPETFEGDFETYIGVYARPKDKPTSLDSSNEKEAREQDTYRINGMVQDFTEWFEWEIIHDKIVE